MKSTFAQRLKEALEMNKMTAAELCRRTHTPESVMSQYKSGKYVAKQRRLSLYSEILDVSIPWLMGEDVPIREDFPANAIPAGNSPTTNIPVIGRVAAGIECFAEENIVDYEPVSPDDITEGDDYAFLKVVGDSMEPQFREGDLVLIRVQPSVDSGSYAVVIVDDENGLVKRVIYDKNWIELQSLNSIYAPRRFEGAEVERIRVFGLVKALKRKF